MKIPISQDAVTQGQVAHIILADVFSRIAEGKLTPAEGQLELKVRTGIATVYERLACSWWPQEKE